MQQWWIYFCQSYDYTYILWFMRPYGLLTYWALLRKLDLSCLTAGPLISSVNCHTLRCSAFYWHIPLPKSSRFTTISINSAWDTGTLHGPDRTITSGLSFDASVVSTLILDHLMIRMVYSSKAEGASVEWVCTWREAKLRSDYIYSSISIRLLSI